MSRTPDGRTLTATMLLLAFSSPVLAAPWQPIGPWYGPVNVLAYAASGTVAYAGTDAGVYRTTDDGLSWQPRSEGLPAARVTALAASLADPDLVIAGTMGSGLHRSTDGGLSWTPAAGGHSDVGDLVATATAFFAGTAGGAYRSTDGGATFTPSGLSGLDVRSITHQALSGNLFAALGIAGDARRSTDGGATWIPASTGLGGTNLYTIAAHPDSAAVFYTGGLGFGSDRDLYKTTNAGLNWQPILSPNFPTFMVVNDIAFDPTGGARLHIGLFGDGVFRTTDGGGTWSAAGAGIGDPEVQTLVARPGVSGSLLCGTLRRAVYGTANAGASWAERAVGISGLTTFAVAVHEATNRIWTGNQTGIVLSTDAGASWAYSDFEGDIGARANAVAPDPVNPAIVWAGTANAFFKGDVLLSTDGGFHWAIDYSPSGGPIFDVVVDPTDTRYVYAAFSIDVVPGGIARTTNGGASWGEVSLGPVAGLSIAIQPGLPARLLAGTDNGLRESTDRGASFHQIAPEMSGFTIWDVAFAASAPGLVWAGTATSGVYRSTDGGASFAPANAGMGNVEVHAIAVRDVPGGRALYAATANGVYRSTDDGDLWVSANEGLLVTDVRAAIWAPGADRILAGTAGAGAWRQDGTTTGVEDGAAPPAIAMHLGTPWPNPLAGSGEVAFGLTLARPSRVAIGVYDTTGRRVRDLGTMLRPSGPTIVRWDGRDAAGRAVASGVYFLRCDAAGEATASTVTIVR